VTRLVARTVPDTARADARGGERGRASRSSSSPIGAGSRRRSRCCAAASPCLAGRGPPWSPAIILTSRRSNTSSQSTSKVPPPRSPCPSTRLDTLPRDRLGDTAHDPPRRDLELPGPCCRHRPPDRGARRRACERGQPRRSRDPLPPRHRRGRRAHGLCRRGLAQGAALGARTSSRIHRRNGLIADPSPDDSRAFVPVRAIWLVVHELVSFGRRRIPFETTHRVVSMRLTPHRGLPLCATLSTETHRRLASSCATGRMARAGADARESSGLATQAQR
jgi:hypothetical protein